MRIWIVQMTSFWPLLVALCLIGLGHGDSPLVILSLCSLALSCVLSFFSFLYLYTLSFPFIFFSLPCVLLHKLVFLNINLYYLSKKKKTWMPVVLYLVMCLEMDNCFYGFWFSCSHFCLTSCAYFSSCFRLKILI